MIATLLQSAPSEGKLPTNQSPSGGDEKALFEKLIGQLSAKDPAPKSPVALKGIVLPDKGAAQSAEESAPLLFLGSRSLAGAQQIAQLLEREGGAKAFLQLGRSGQIEKLLSLAEQKQITIKAIRFELIEEEKAPTVRVPLRAPQSALLALSAASPESTPKRSGPPQATLLGALIQKDQSPSASPRSSAPATPQAAVITAAKRIEPDRGAQPLPARAIASLQEALAAKAPIKGAPEKSEAEAKSARPRRASPSATPATTQSRPSDRPLPPSPPQAPAAPRYSAASTPELGSRSKAPEPTRGAAQDNQTKQSLLEDVLRRIPSSRTPAVNAQNQAAEKAVDTAEKKQTQSILDKESAPKKEESPQARRQGPQRSATVPPTHTPPPSRAAADSGAQAHPAQREEKSQESPRPASEPRRSSAAPQQSAPGSPEKSKHPTAMQERTETKKSGDRPQTRASHPERPSPTQREQTPPRQSGTPQESRAPRSSAPQGHTPPSSTAQSSVTQSSAPQPQSAPPPSSTPAQNGPTETQSTPPTRSPGSASPDALATQESDEPKQSANRSDRPQATPAAERTPAGHQARPHQPIAQSDQARPLTPPPRAGSQEAGRSNLAEQARAQSEREARSTLESIRTEREEALRRGEGMPRSESTTRSAETNTPPQPGSVRLTPPQPGSTASSPTLTTPAPQSEVASARQGQSGGSSENPSSRSEGAAALNQALEGRIRMSRSTLNHFASHLKEAVENYKPPLMRVAITLSPKDLGEIEVILKSRGKRLQISMQSNPQALALLYQNSTEFRQNLQQIGFADVGLSFEGEESGEQSRGEGGAHPDDRWQPPGDAKEGHEEEPEGTEVALAPKKAVVEIPLYG